MAKLTGRLAQVLTAAQLCSLRPESVVEGRLVGQRVLDSLESRGLLKRSDRPSPVFGRQTHWSLVVSHG